MILAAYRVGKHMACASLSHSMCAVTQRPRGLCLRLCVRVCVCVCVCVSLSLYIYIYIYVIFPVYAGIGYSRFAQAGNGIVYLCICMK